ncbi:MAG TPA: hypothetical protein PLS94_11715, partial [Prolixibacteraceae bacterium]|nr:hypothetical protein [Prolixibacteraceae bacterium]
FVSIKNSGLTPQVSQNIAGIIANFDQSSVLTNFVDSGKFIAEPMPFSLPLPAETKTDNSYYRNVEASYTITSCMPPTSVLKGRLLYEWKTDEAHTKRPMSNTHFRVIVDYVDGDGKSIGAIQNTSNQAEGIITGHWESDYFVPEGSNEPMSLVDQYTTMAEGMTDSAGYFTIEVVNINQKGNLGSGYLQHNEGGSAPPIVGQSIKDKVLGAASGNEVINPAPYDYANMFGNNFNTISYQQTASVQSTINSGTFNVGFDAGSQSFELGNVQAGAMNKAMGMVIQNDEFMGNAHGPNPGTASSPMADDNTPPQYFEQFKRTYRIVIDGNKAPYFYPSQKVIDDVQAFESMAAPIDIPHFVKEFKLKVKTVEINDEQEVLPLTQVQATIFRKGNKNNYLPLGEGDGKYTYAELLNPVYHNTGNNASFEQLWPKQTVNADGTTNILGGLLQSEKYNYAIQASSFVNTGSKTYESTIVDMPTIIDNNLNWSNPVIPEDSVTIVLTPLPSRILVHVKDNLSGQPLGSSRNTRVQFSNMNIPYFWLNDQSAPVDNYGYLELFVDQPPLSEYFNNQTEQSNIYLTASAEGFNQPEALYKTTLRKMGSQATPTLSLLPAANITGRIIDADYQATNGQIIFNGVRAYIQADSSTIFETDNFGSFDMPIAPKAGVEVKIIPKDVAWFDTVYVLTAADAQKKTIDIGELKVYRRKHRILFNITQKMPPGFTGPPTPISGATIQLGPDMVISTANGVAKFEFENVSVNNYTFIVRGPQGEGYIPKTVNVTNTESRDFKYINIELEQGSQISGTVTLDGNAVKNARVYLEAYTSNTPMEHSSYSNILQNASSIITSNNTATSSNDMSLLEARTNAKGNFTIKGIPVNNQNINIIATLDTTFTVSGDKKTITISNGNGQANLSLTSFKDITVNKLFGFPLSVENITNVNATQIRVTGLVHWTEAISDFTLSDNNKLLRVENVLFNIVTGIGGKKTAVPVNNSIAIQGVTNLKMSYLGKYNVKLTSAEQTQAYNSTPLTLSKENDLGTISGKMQIVDNSFNYPSSYLNFDNSEFYLAKLNPDSTINNKVSVVTSAFTISESQSANYIEPIVFLQHIASQIASYQQKPAAAYNLCNINGKSIQFKLINFDASADPKNSYIDVYGKIHLDTRLNCYIPNAQPENISVSIPDMVLDENKVYPALATKPITLKLEEWELEARNWSFSTTEGGILSTNALLKTNIIDIPVGKFVLRSDMFFMKDFEYSNLSMAGGKIKFDYIAQGCAHLNYESKVGSDMKPHWNFSLLGSATGKVASLPQLNGLTNYDIDLNYVEILSNNEMIVQLMQKTEKPLLHNNPVAQFEPLSIFNGPSYIGVTGLLNTKAPRISEILLTVNWTDTIQQPAFENVSVEFQGKGFVHFEANKKKIEIDENEVRIEGKVLEKPNLTFNPMPATFFAERNETYHVDIRKDWITQLSQKENLVNFSSPATSSVGYRLKIAKGGMQVINNDWGLLSYEGDMISNETNTENIAPSYTKFEVLGEVKASTENLSISSINTPIGKMEQVYNFEAMEMRGSLNIDAPVTMGALTLNHGTIETLFDKNGFYVAGSCNAYLLAGLLTGTYNLGFLAGSYDKTAKNNLDKAWNITNSYINPKVVNTCYKTETLDAEGLNGIYTAVNRQVLNTSKSFDFILASGYVRAEVLLGGDFYANFSETAIMGSDAFLFIDVGAGLSSISGTSISGGVMANAQFSTKLTINPNSLEIKGSLDMNFNGTIEQSLGIETISKSFDVNCYVGATYNTQSGTEFDFNLG